MKKKMLIIIVSIVVLIIGILFLHNYIELKPIRKILKEYDFYHESGYMYSQKETKRYFYIYSKDEFYYSNSGDFDINYDIELVNKIQDKFDINNYISIIEECISRDQSCEFYVFDKNYRFSFDYTVLKESDYKSVNYEIDKISYENEYGGIEFEHTKDDTNLSSDIRLFDKLFKKNLSIYEKVINRKIEDMIEMNEYSNISFEIENDEFYINYFSSRDGNYRVEYRLRNNTRPNHFSYSSQGIPTYASIDKDLQNIKEIYEIDLFDYKEEIIDLIDKTRESGKTEFLSLDQITINISLDENKEFYYLFASIKTYKKY